MFLPCIPQEITDYILDFLHDNPKALRACARVCRAWQPTSYYHIFSHISLQSPEACASFSQHLQDTPSIGQLVRSLDIVLQQKAKDSDSISRPFSSTACATLNALKHLSITVWNFDTNNCASLVTFETLTHLTLHYCRFPTFQTLTAFIHAFPNLRAVDIGDVSWDRQEPELTWAKPLHRDFKLKKLTLGAVTSLPAIVDWLLEGDTYPELDSISVHCASESDVIALGLLCTAVGDSILHLQIDWLLRRTSSCGFIYVSTIVKP